MPSTFFALGIGQSALASSQLALDVISNNTANINTPGYSRQTVSLDENSPYTLPDAYNTGPGQLGTGVTVASINRVRSNFIDQSVWAANADQGAVNSLSNTLSEVQNAFNEPSAGGIGEQMSNFFNAFSNLAANPESGAVRTTVIDQAVSLTNEFHSVNTALSQISPDLNNKIKADVTNINQIATQIASLNKQIGISVAAGQNPNDLEDKRGALLDTLSNLVGAQVTYTNNPTTGKPDGEVNVNVGGYALVQGETSNALPATVTTANNQFGLVSAAGETIPVQSGELYGLIKATNLVAGYQSNLDSLAADLITAVNNIHQSGYGLDGSTGNPFFSPLTGSSQSGAAASISVSPVVLNDPSKIAAAAPPSPPNSFAPGNGDIANQIASLATTPVVNGLSLNTYYSNQIAQIGADAQTYQQESSNQQSVLTQLQNQQQSVSGVNLDEELTNMLQYERAYQAAARVINTADLFVSTVINGLGAGSGSVTG